MSCFSMHFQGAQRAPIPNRKAHTETRKQTSIDAFPRVLRCFPPTPLLTYKMTVNQQTWKHIIRCWHSCLLANLSLFRPIPLSPLCPAMCLRVFQEVFMFREARCPTTKWQMKWHLDTCTHLCLFCLCWFPCSLFARFRWVFFLM